MLMATTINFSGKLVIKLPQKSKLEVINAWPRLVEMEMKNRGEINMDNMNDSKLSDECHTNFIFSEKHSA